MPSDQIKSGIDAEVKRFLKYLYDQGLSIMPLRTHPPVDRKKPALEIWKHLQEKRASWKQIMKWWQTGKHNIGVICGRISGNLVVLDFDEAKVGYKLFGKTIGKTTFVVKTGRKNGGIHVYFRTIFPVRKFKIEELAIDVQGEGAYVVAPPSIHESGKQYEAQKFQGQPIATWDGLDFEEDLFKRIKGKYKKFKPSKHRNQIDAEVLLKGVTEGNRNQALIHLATWYRRGGKTEEDAVDHLKIWNDKLDKPLPEQELLRTVHSAYRIDHPYHYWFKQNPEAYKEMEQFTKEEIKESEKFLTLNVEEKFNFIDYALGELVREEKTKISLFLLQIMKESVHVGGDSAAGKSHLCDIIMECFPKNSIWKITGMTDKSIRYLKEHIGTLYIAEFGALGKGKDREESTSQFDVKMLISEGKLALSTTERNPETNKFETNIYINENVKNVITTSTDVDITNELKNRMWILAIDETHEQTALIRRRRTMESEGEIVDRSQEKKILRYAMQLLFEEAEDKKIIIPYATLIEHIVSEQSIRTRRDINKLYNAVKAVAKLNYRNRSTWNDKIIAMPEDFYFAMKYMVEAITGTFTETSKRFWRKWNLTKQVLKAGKRTDVETMQKIFNCHKRTAYTWLDRFVQAGLVRKVAEPVKGSKAKVYYVQTLDTPKEDSITIEMKDLFEKTEQWLTKHKCKNNGDNGGLNQNNKFYNRKINIPISTTTIATIIKNLPDAPEFIDDDVISWKDSGMKKQPYDNEQKRF